MANNNGTCPGGADEQVKFSGGGRLVDTPEGRRIDPAIQKRKTWYGGMCPQLGVAVPVTVFPVAGELPAGGMLPQGAKVSPAGNSVKNKGRSSLKHGGTVAGKTEACPVMASFLSDASLKQIGRIHVEMGKHKGNQAQDYHQGCEGKNCFFCSASCCVHFSLFSVRGLYKKSQSFRLANL